MRKVSFYFPFFFWQKRFDQDLSLFRRTTPKGDCLLAMKATAALPTPSHPTMTVSAFDHLSVYHNRVPSTLTPGKRFSIPYMQQLRFPSVSFAV